MSERGKRIYVEPDESALRVLVAERGARGINAILRQHARCVRWAARRVELQFDALDWQMIAASLSPGDCYPRPDGYFSAETVAAQVDSAQRVFKVGKSIFGACCKSRVEQLVEQLSHCGELEIEAILLAVRWRHTAHGAEEGTLPWWRLERREAQAVPSLVMATG